jgi:hypothetical protein
MQLRNIKRERSLVLLARIAGLYSGTLFAASHSLLGLRFPLHVVLGVFTTCLGVEEVDVYLSTIFLVFFVGKQIINLALMVL